MRVRARGRTPAAKDGAKLEEKKLKKPRLKELDLRKENVGRLNEEEEKEGERVGVEGVDAASGRWALDARGIVSSLFGP